MASISSSLETLFNINNVPYGIITSNGEQKKRCATVLGDFAVDLGVLHAEGIFHGVPGLDGNPFMRVSLITQTLTVILAAFRAQHTLKQDYLNVFAALPKATHKAVRERLIQHLSQLGLVSTSKLPAGFMPLSEVKNHFPMDTRNFT
ncbi:uncharacterized protein TRUGW13939_10320 [Talaromyces rugulosus]|uniref:Fumarylacetoacetase N-terminal domain-containing protein n=1 Tax=Talaromyces rugulosus TaxID=121627 RepID=A0A7H8RBH4_TALRU|nr:uncharacterized protein TRUGW13939_10320 [Talaromyces rugulosus]QKX63151.1 hypothetical protein TRUGW13939_10320 [Talaromyces rugulosus]